MTAVTRTRKVPRCPGIHGALLTRPLDFAFVPPISVSAKLSEMRFLSSVEFFFFSNEKMPGVRWGRWGQQHHLQFPSIWLRNGWLIFIMALYSKHDRLSSETVFITRFVSAAFTYFWALVSEIKRPNYYLHIRF